MALRWNEASRTLDLGVRDLILAEERHVRATVAMSSRARLLAGVELHRAVQAGHAEEEPGFRAEVRMRHTLVVREWTCTIHGRVDGLSEEDDRTVIEEIKSTALTSDGLDAIDRFPEWERQLGLYVHLARAARMPDPVGRLRVVSLVDGAQRVLVVTEPAGLEAEIHARLDEWILARERRIAWRAVRRSATVYFAHGERRPRQREIADAVEAAVREGGHLLLTAPTGIGKTAAVLEGALRAAAALDKRIFYATARTTQQAMVEGTVRRMVAAGTPLRAVTILAKDKACLNGVVDCRPEVCRFAEGYHDRLRAGRVVERLMELGHPDAAAVRALGVERELCPYELALDWAVNADLVIGDYNYAFDPDVRLRRCFEDPREWVLVVEEAHQLPDRASGWGSPALAAKQAEDFLALAPASWAVFRAIARDVAEAIEDAALLPVGEVGGELLVEPHPRRWAALRERIDEVAFDHARVREGEDDPWEALARGVIHFSEVLDRAGEETVALWSPGRLRLFCRDPARLLAPRFAAAHASIAMSATLAPAWFYRERCGLDANRVSEHVAASPFPPENRHVVTVPAVSTAFRHRARDRAAIVEILERTVHAVPGNAAVFFPSFELLDDLAGATSWPGRERLVQTPAMSEPDRAELLARMRDPAGAPRVLCAVLGGIFAEGVDLPNDALRAAIVVSPALPPPSAERALLQAWYEERFDQGFDLAYIQPGMTKVVQAAGRVVRGADDRGLVVLLCQRFARHEFAAYLPSDWEIVRHRRPWEAAARFFSGE